MARKLIFHASIPDDLVSAIAYYDRISVTLGDRFRDNVKLRLAQVSERPESFPTDIGPIRFARVERFPYLIFFVARTESILVLAIVHGSSNPDRWRNRVNLDSGPGENR